MKSKAVTPTPVIETIGLWVGPDRSVESSFVFLFIIIIIVKSKRQRPDARYRDYRIVVLCCVVLCPDRSVESSFCLFIIIIMKE
jgi:hypothetical protein